MKIELENVKPMEIERRSFEIITRELGDKELQPGTEPIVKRCIHTSADFDYADNLCFSPGAVEAGLKAIRAGCDIVTDTQMAKAGISKKTLAKYGGEVFCFMSDEDVAEAARRNGTTRAVASMDKAARRYGTVCAGSDMDKATGRYAATDMDTTAGTHRGTTVKNDADKVVTSGKPVIFAIGNAPTALVRLYELIAEGKIRPALIIGVPVGFVNVVQSKELIMQTDVPFIVARGRKGGSNIAACICNALLYMLEQDRSQR